MFHGPEMVHKPVETVMVPLAPPVTVTLVTATVEAFAVRIPPFPMTNTAVESPRPAVASSVVEEPSETVSVPLHRRARVAIVNVCGVPAADVNVTLLNSASLKLAPAKVIVPAETASKVVVPVPASQLAVVLLFVQVPPKFQRPLPKSMKEVASIDTAPSISPSQAATPQEMFAPPVIVSVPVAVSPFVALAPTVMARLLVS